MSGVSALIDIYKMTEVSVEERISLLHALGEIVNYEINLLEEMDLLYAKIHRLEDICEQANIMLNQRDEIEEGLNKRIAELESENGRLQESWLWETVCPDGSLRPKVSELLLNLDGWKERSNGWESIVETLNTRIAELEGENKKAFDFVKTLRTYCIYAHWDNPDIEGEFNEFDAEICKWLSEFTEREE